MTFKYSISELLEYLYMVLIILNSVRKSISKIIFNCFNILMGFSIEMHNVFEKIYCTLFTCIFICRGYTKDYNMLEILSLRKIYNYIYGPGQDVFKDWENKTSYY